jgi:membrane-bound lytic murein transglycosylase A
MMRRSLFTIIFLLAACTAAPETLQWHPITYQDIPGWQQDRHAEALQAFRHSCTKPKPSQAAILPLIDKDAWKEACAEAERIQGGSHQQARHFFEYYFTPYQLTTNQRQTGLLTGYYVPVFNGSLQRTERFAYPVYGLPDDIVKGQEYFSRAEIDNGALANRGLELTWVEDPVMLFFLHIQGSGRLRLPDGQMIELRYAGKNNQAYVAIGKILLDRGEIAKEDLSLQSIRQWLYDHPQEAQSIMHANPSYVFFTRHDAESMPPGAQGATLTPERSIAIDPSQLPYGLPVFISTRITDAKGHEKPFHRLLLTQDTGGAIKGPLRGDLFFGQGEDAEPRAGSQKQSGEWVALIPTRHDHEAAQAE